MPRIIVDPDSASLTEKPALVKSTRKARARFTEACVLAFHCEQAACDEAEARPGWLPAVVYGPSSSSEGQRLYYLVRWIQCPEKDTE